MPRRIPAYPDGYADWNNIMSFGSILTAISVLIFLYILAFKLFNYKKEPVRATFYSFNN